MERRNLMVFHGENEFNDFQVLGNWQVMCQNEMMGNEL